MGFPNAASFSINADDRAKRANDAAVEASQGLREQRDALHAKIAELSGQAKALSAQILAVERAAYMAVFNDDRRIQ